MGGGVGLLDYDGDGWLDVYCVQGGPFPPGEPGRPPQRRSPLPQPGRRHLRGRDEAGGALRPPRRLRPRGGGRRLSTMTAGPTSSSRAGGPTPCIATRGTAPSRTSRRRPGWGATGIGRPRRPGPTSTATATSTSTSATTWPATPSTRRCGSSSGSARPRVLRPSEIRPDAGPPLPQRRGEIRRRDGRGRHRRPRREGAGRGRGRPRRRRPGGPVCRQRYDGELTSSGTSAASGSRRSASPPAWRRAPAAGSRRGWGSPAATSTATACRTWP